MYYLAKNISVCGYNVYPAFIHCSSTIRDKIIPHAVSWFTGEAAEGDELELSDEEDEDDDDEEDDEDEEEDEDDDEDDEEEKVEVKSRKKVVDVTFKV